MKDLFTAHEWKLLKLLPFQAFVLVAGADGVVDDREGLELSREMDGARELKNRLHRELLMELSREGRAQYIERATIEHFDETLDQVKPILRDRLTKDEYQQFARSLFLSAVKVARASGGSREGDSNSISAQERTALAAFAMLYEIEPSMLMEDS